ncbi:MAG: hypothetical protein M1371_00350 [Actinobacteria bacterium]|nr:hypothetical protein [Actinomycetota bacterium]
MKKFITLISLIAILIPSTLIMLSGCGGNNLPGVEEITEETTAKGDEAKSTNGEKETTEEVVEVDYDNAQYGAEYIIYMTQYIPSGKETVVKATIKNTSDFTWNANGQNPVRLGYHLDDVTPGSPQFDGTGRGELAHNVKPGESIDIFIPMSTPDAPGYYNVNFDMVIEGILWFSSKGVPTHTRVRVYFGP